MTRISRMLLLVVLAEIFIGGFLIARRMQRPVPPEADWMLLDPTTADQIKSAIAKCETANDWRDLGEMYMAAGCFAESELCHRIACELAPDNALYARQWGFALERIGLLDEANAQYRRAIELRIADPDACRYFIARNHLRAENPAEARRVFAEGQSLPANRYELAKLHRREGDLEQAAKWLRGVADVRPNALQVHQLGYRIAIERGDPRQAFLHADRATFAPEKLQNPFDEEAERNINATKMLGPNRHWKQGSEWIDAGKLDEAERLLEDAAGVDRSPAVVELLADVAVHRGQFDKAIALLSELEKPNGPAALVEHIGDVWDVAGKPEKARANWLRAIEIGAGLDFKAAHLKLAQSLTLAGDKSAADYHLSRSRYYSARELLKIGRPDNAIPFLEAAVELDPKFELGWFYLGEARRLAGQQEPARVAYQACLGLNPDHGRALSARAFLKADKK